MRRAYFYIIIFFLSAYSYGQEPKIQTSNQLSLNILVPSLEWEVPLKPKSTFDLKIGTSIGFSRAGDDTEIGFFPELESQYRYYYNFEKRQGKGKKVTDNSGNYIFGLGSIRSGNSIIGEMDIQDDYAAFFGPGWGLQRVYNSGFKLNLNLGAGYGINDLGDSYFAPFIGIQLGWVLAR